MRPVSRSLSWWFVLAVVVGAACGGEKIKVGDGKAASELKGRVLIAPVVGSTVTAYKADAQLVRGAVLATGTTNETGDFALSLPPYQGHVLLVATAGTYNEPSIGLGVQLGTAELTMLLPDFTTGSKPSGLRVTAVSTLAVEFARWHVVAKGEQPGAAYSGALVHLHQHFGGVDWATVTPSDLTVDGVTNLSPEAKAGLVLAGFSWLSKTQAETSNVQPGLVLNAATLVAALAADSSDGTLDGKQAAASLSQGQVALSGLSVRNELVSAMSQFIVSTRNKSALRLSDISSFLAAIGTNADPYLFCPGQVASETCGSGPVDTEPPVLSFVRPSNGAGVAGSTVVEVHASDNTKLGTLRFAAPAALSGTGVVWTNDQREGSLTATLDVSALPDGPLEIRAETTDEAGNPVARSITIIVSNQGPEISISSPSNGVVQGAGVSIAASATARAPGATIARIELVSPLDGGVSQDLLPAADAFAALWNTVAMPEGTAVVTLRAVDTYGTATEASVPVVVDNVPFGTVSGVVNAGAPVDGLHVKLMAIDDATGLPVVGRLGGSILGQTTEPSVDGGFSFTLTQENYAGPVQLVAEGTGTASYVDPTDEAAPRVILPGTMRLSSFVPFYTTGQQLSRPVTYWTSLADTATLAFAAGRNPVSPTPSSLTASLATIDPLFASHIVASSTWDMRQVYPASLTSTPQSLGDVVFAAAPDVSLNQLARQIATDVGLTPVSGFSAAHLVSLLQSDISDGQFDGKANGAQLSTAGTSPYSLTADTTRFRQAIALDLFVRSTNNKSGLSRQDFQTSAIYDTISMDTSILYPASAVPTQFDNLPPTVAWTLTYQRDSSTVVPAVGSAQLVRALSFVVAEASDASGVDSMVITLDGVPVAANPGSTALHFVGSIDTVAWSLSDGAHVLSAHVCDRLTNCGDVTTTITVDNTAPVINIVSPALNRQGGFGAATPKFFSSSFQVEAGATDSNGVGSLLVTAPTVGTDTDAAPEHLLVYAPSWNLGSAVDGLSAVQFSSCDVVGNCTGASRAYIVDRTPPTIDNVSAGAAYTNLSQVTVVVSATDTGAGVKERWVQLGTSAPVLATERTFQGNIFYGATVDISGQTNVQLKVWATDMAEPGNSGEASAAPYAKTLSFIRDVAPPAVATRSPTSYRDERGLTVAKDAQGRPVMPVQYQYAGAALVVGENGRIYKLNSKMGAGDPNEAFVRWAVTTPTSSESPISSATYRVTFVPAADGSNACAVTACPSGNLRLSAGSEQFQTLYELPLNSTTMVLNSRNTFEVTFRDAAQNSTTRTFTIEHTAVGAPIVVWRDTQYSTYTDTHNYFRRSYTALFGKVSRVVRWVVYNPNLEPVTLVTNDGMDVSWTEAFSATTVRLGSNGFGGWNPNAQISDGTLLTVPARRLQYTHRPADICNTSTCGIQNACIPTASDCPTFATPGMNLCPGADFTHPLMINNQYAEPIHWLGTQPTPEQVFDCNLVSGSPQALRYAPSNAVNGWAGIETYNNPAPQGGETVPATISGGGVLLPAATSVTAGAVAVYSGIYLDARASTGVPAVDLPTTGGPFQVAFFYKLQSTLFAAGPTCTWNCGPSYNPYTSYMDEYWMYALYWQLQPPTIPYAGSLSVTTKPVAVQPVSLTVSAQNSTWPSVPFSL